MTGFWFSLSYEILGKPIEMLTLTNAGARVRVSLPHRSAAPTTNRGFSFSGYHAFQ